MVAPGLHYMPKSNSLFVDQPPVVLKKLAYIHLTIHQFKAEIFRHVEIDFSLWDLFSAIGAEGTCPTLLMTLQLQLLAPLVAKCKSKHETQPQQWMTPENLPTAVTWPEEVRQVRCRSS